MPKLFRGLAALCVAACSLMAAAAPPAASSATSSATSPRLPPGITHVTAVEGITEYRLANGLQLLLVPDDSKPTTTVNLTYRVGSRQENYGETGMAHLLEHLLFKGTPTHPKVWAEFEKRGLAANGSTAFDRTNYTARFSASDDNLKWYLGWQADAMVHSFIARRDLDTEMTVVRNEMEAGENRPDGILLQRTLAVMFDWHNYGKETIGARADVENVDIPRLQAFYRLYYQPDNATLIVSGRFDPRKVLGWVADAFGKIPRPTRRLPIQYTLDPAQDGERSVTLRRAGGAPLLYAAYHVPAAADPDFAAIELLALALVLADEPSGRLHKRLTEHRLAASVFGFAWDLAEPGVLVLGAQLGPEQAAEPARDALIDTVESLAREPLTAEELQRAKAKWIADWERAFANPEAIGLSLSDAVAQGDWRLFFFTRDRVRDIALADVQRIGAAYLLSSNRTLGTYLPTDQPQRAPAPKRVDMAQAMSGFKPEAAAAAVEAFDATPQNIEARTRRFTVGGLKAAVLPKGTRGNAVQAVLVLRFGDASSLAGQGELSSAVASLLDKGSQTLTREQVQDRLDALHTRLRIGGNDGEVRIGLSSRRDDLPAAIALVGELLRHPRFAPESLDELKRQALTGIEQQRNEPQALAGNVLERLGNPYPRGDARHAPTFDEMVEDVNALTIDRLRAFHARFYSAAQGEFSAVGDVDPVALEQALQTALGDWRGGVPFQRLSDPLVAVPGQRLVLPAPDKRNAVLLVRQRLPLMDTDPDCAAVTMANELLGGGGSSRLWRRIREADGLSYDVRSAIQWDSEERNSPWVASAIFAPQNRPKVEAAFREEVARALKEGFTDQELREAQAGLLSFRRLSRAQDASMAGTLANHLYLGRTFEHAARVDAALQAVTLDQANAALRRYLRPDDFVFVFAGDFKD